MLIGLPGFAFCLRCEPVWFSLGHFWIIFGHPCSSGQELLKASAVYLEGFNEEPAID